MKGKKCAVDVKSRDVKSKRSSGYPVAVEGVEVRPYGVKTRRFGTVPKKARSYGVYNELNPRV